MDFPDAPVVIRDEIDDAARRAVAVGADPSTLEYVGAGGEGIVFADRGLAYKVGRPGRSLEDEALALGELSAMGAPVPSFAAWFPSENVIVRSMVEGRPGSWSDARVLEDLWRDEIIPALAAAEFTRGEFKENSFIIPEGHPVEDAVMIDLGFVYPTGSRNVAKIDREVAAADERTKLHPLSMDVQLAVSSGDADAETARRWVARLEQVFGRQRVAGLRREVESSLRYQMKENPTDPNDQHFLGYWTRELDRAARALDLNDLEDFDRFQSYLQVDLLRRLTSKQLKMIAQSLGTSGGRSKRDTIASIAKAWRDRRPRSNYRPNPPYSGYVKDWWEKPHPKNENRIAYQTKTDALNVFADHNRTIIDDYGGEGMVHSPESFEAINHLNGLKGKRRVNTIAKALWWALPSGGPPWYLEDIDVELLNRTAPAIYNQRGLSFHLPDFAEQERLLAQEEAYNMERWEERQEHWSGDDDEILDLGEDEDPFW